MGEMADYYNEQAKMEEAASMPDDPVKVAAERLGEVRREAFRVFLRSREGQPTMGHFEWEAAARLAQDEAEAADPGFQGVVGFVVRFAEGAGLEGERLVANAVLHLLLHGKENDDA